MILILNNSNKHLVSKVTWIRSSNENRGAFVGYADSIKAFVKTKSQSGVIDRDRQPCSYISVVSMNTTVIKKTDIKTIF